MRLEGKVESGLGKGKYYMSKKVYQEAFKQKIGFIPFPGTLNLKVDEESRKRFEKNTKTIKLRDIRDGDKKLSDVDITPCMINNIECGLLNLEITDHPYSTAEVIAPVKLRNELKLQNGDEVILKTVEELDKDKLADGAQEATLCFVFNDKDVLLIRKKRGVGQGLYNGPGGKLEDNESPEECAIRETKEETKITPRDLEKKGEILFVFGDEPFMHTYIFRSENYRGTAEETEEADPEWFEVDNIPYEEMWPDEKYWVPKMLNNEDFKAVFRFDEDGDKILEFNIDTDVDF